jgi:hypothetical protein
MAAVHRAGLVLLSLTFACAADRTTFPPETPQTDAGTPNARAEVVLVAGGPSHGPGEHEYYAGAMILKAMLAQSNIGATVVRGGWPEDAAILDDALAIVLLTDGNAGHPLQVGARFDVLERALARGIGFACIHWSVHVLEPFSARMLAALGGHYSDPISVNPHWDARFTTFPAHPITRGVAPFTLRDEWYYNMKFTAASEKLVPVLSAMPPDETRFTTDAAAHPGRAETVAWAYERSDGGRSFGFTGAHFHQNWGTEPFRRTVVNGLLWILGRDVPENGAPVVLDPATLSENLDPK